MVESTYGAARNRIVESVNAGGFIAGMGLLGDVWLMMMMMARRYPIWPSRSGSDRGNPEQSHSVRGNPSIESIKCIDRGIGQYHTSMGHDMVYIIV